MEIRFPSDELVISGNVELEIGCGNGEFIKFLVGQNPNINYIGVDVSWQSIKRASKKLMDFGNVVLIWGDVWPFLMFGAKNLKFHRVYSLFPDPWPKKRHIHKRIFSEDFWKLLTLRVKPDGQVSIVSDHLSALMWFYDNAVKSGCWWGYVSESYREFGTKYERKWREMGKTIYEAIFFLENVCDFKIPETELNIPKLKGIKPKDLTGDYVLPDGSHFVVKETFVCDDFMLIKGIISEDKLLHKVWFEIRRVGEYWKVEPSDFSKFYPTRALQYALNLIADEISR